MYSYPSLCTKLSGALLVCSQYRSFSSTLYWIGTLKYLKENGTYPPTKSTQDNLTLKLRLKYINTMNLIQILKIFIYRKNSEHPSNLPDNGLIQMSLRIFPKHKNFQNLHWIDGIDVF